MTLKDYRSDVALRIGDKEMRNRVRKLQIDNMINLARSKIVSLIRPKKFKQWWYFLSVAGKEKYDLGNIPAQDTDRLIDEYSFRYEYDRESRNDTIGTGDGSNVNFSGVLKYNKVVESSITIIYTFGGNDYTVTDNGLGSFVGDGSGTINYERGAYVLTCNNAPDNGTSVDCTYETRLYKKLISKTFHDMDKNNEGWQSSALGIPENAIMFGNLLILSPAPDTNNRRIEIFGLVSCNPLLDDTSVCDIPEIYQSYVVPLTVFELTNNENGITEMEGKLAFLHKNEMNRARPKRRIRLSSRRPSYGRHY